MDSEDVVYFKKNIFYVVFEYVGVAVSSFLLIFVFTRFSDQEIYGKYSYVYAVLGILSLFSLPGINVAITQAVARNFHGVFKMGTKVRLKYSLLGSGILLFLGGYFLFKGDMLLGKTFLVCSLLFPGIYAIDTYMAFLNGKHEFKGMLIARILCSFLPALFTAWVVLYSKNIMFIMAVNLMVLIAVNACLFFTILKTHDQNKRQDPDAIRYGKHISALNVMGAVKTYLDKLLIGMFLGFSSLAIYSLSKAFANQARASWPIIHELTLPKLSESNLKGGFTKAKSLLKHAMPVSVIIYLLVILLLPVIIPFLFTHDYVRSVLPAQVLVLACLIAIPGQQFEVFLRSQKKSKELYKLKMSFHVIEVMLLLPFIYFWGIMGVVFSQLFSRLFYSALSWKLSRECVKAVS